MKKLNYFFTSGIDPNSMSEELKSQYQMLNVGFILSSLGLIFGMTTNYLKGNSDLIYVETTLVLINIVLFLLLRRSKEYSECVATFFTGLFTVFFLYLMYNYNPDEMKHVWLFTYPIIVLYYQELKKALLWLFVVCFMILIAPFQPFFETLYSPYQAFYILFVVLIVASTMYFYKMKINEARRLILDQKEQLENFNKKLEEEVELKTTELRNINESLEITVEQKIEELIQKDRLICAQSKQAVMGEMITMIAHQWRQPLSTITLQISNYQFKQLLHKDFKKREIDITLEEISDTIMYLSNTIDDFQTYFHPNKKTTEIEIHELVQKSINFIIPRLKNTKIDVNLNKGDDIVVKVYMNELIQVILNLLNNAIDALVETDRDGLKVTLDVKDEGETILITVCDNANGINPDVVDKIFEPYFSTKGKNGTGLGLYMSQMIIQKQFEGIISVESSENGSTFMVKIPKILS